MYKERLARFAVSITMILSLLGLIPQAGAGFDGDGFRDLVVSVPSEDVNSQANAGMVMEVEGGAAGITLEHDLWHQDSGLVDACEADDYLGRALAIGDFDGDGYFDLAIGVPMEDVGGLSNAGAVQVIYGSSVGLNTSGDQFLTQDGLHAATSAEEGDLFGFAVAAADFNGDGYDDLAMGSVREDIGSLNNMGEVVVIFGSESGLVTTGSQWIIQSYYDADYRFGARLAAGDFDNDGFADLAVAAPGTVVSGFDDAGVVDVFWGSASYLAERTGVSRWHQDIAGVQNECAEGDSFGSSLAVGDLNGDGFDDLAVGVAQEDIGPADNVGMVHLLYGVPGGLTGNATPIISQNTFGSDQCEENDQFGTSLAFGDFDGDGFDDLVIGTPWEDIGSVLPNTGLVQIVYGSATGPDGDLTLWEDSLSNRAVIQEDDRFGFALAAGDLNDDGFDDLAMGAPWKDLSGETDAGTVYIAYGSDAGLSMDNDYLDQCTSGYWGGCDSDDHFGWALAIVPERAPMFSDGFESGNLTRWDSSSP